MFAIRSQPRLSRARRYVTAVLRRRATTLTLSGCALYGIALLLPAMRWAESERHASGGSATVFGDGVALVDFGFGGTELLPVSVLAVAVLAAAAVVFRAGRRAWWLRAVLVGAAGYCPLWVAHVFLRKAEDQVWPAEGAVLLGAATALLMVSTWASRPGESSSQTD